MSLKLKKLRKLFGLFTGRILPKTRSYNFAGIEHFSFSYSVGNWSNAKVCYNLQLKDGEYTATVKQKGVAEEDADTFAVSAEFAKELEDILIANNVEKWNGFQKSDLRVLDGYDFDLYIKNQTGQSLSAMGYMVWPKNYKSVKEALNDLFMKLYA